MQHSCSHYNAIRNQRLKKRIELRRQTQPLVAKHIGGTNSRMKRPQPHPPHTRGTLHRRLQPLSTEKHKVSCSGFLPNSPLPFLTTSHRHHFPSSPPPFVHFPSSLIPFLTTSHRPHLPSSPFPFIIASLRHHFPSSPLPFVTTSLRHHCVMLCSYVLLCALPPFIKVNSTASYSCVMYCCVMYCYVIYHPSSRSIPPLLILLLCIVMLCIVL